VGAAERTIFKSAHGVEENPRPCSARDMAPAKVLELFPRLAERRSNLGISSPAASSRCSLSAVRS